MVKYSDGKVYKIVCNKTGKQYIGSTCVGLSQRLAEHRNHYKKFSNGTYRYSSAKIVIENGDFEIILLEECPCETREQLLLKEREWIDKLECVNVTKKPILFEGEQSSNIIRYNSDAEYRQEVLAKNKTWRQNTDQDKLREYTKLKARRLRLKWGASKKPTTAMGTSSSTAQNQYIKTG